MKEENDPLHSVLREWEAPQASSAMDSRVRAAYRTAYRPASRLSGWRRIWSAQVTFPVPVLAAALLIMMAAALWFQFRSGSPGSQPVPPPTTVASPGDGYTTRIETAGFKPLPDGATRVIRSGAKP